jgi:molecular chaperone DnaJ
LRCVVVVIVIVFTNELLVQQDIFSQMFNGGFGGGGFGGGGGGFGGGFGGQQQDVPNRGQDVEMTARLSFLEAALGATKTLSYNAMKRCKPCKGSGAKENKPEKQTCKSCGGSGFVEQVLQGMFRVQQPCGTCGGKGHKIKNPCTSCRGR